MLWAILSLFSGLGDSITYWLIKKLDEINDISLLLFRYVFSLPFVFLLSFFYSWHNPAWEAYIVAFLNAVVFVAANYYIIKALHISPFSLAMPMLSFTPIFLALVSFIFLNEVPSVLGGIGIILVVFGVYILNFRDFEYGILDPFRRILRVSFRPIRGNDLRNLAAMGFSSGFLESLALVAFLFAITPYVLSIKRTSILFSVLIGLLFFKEKNYMTAILGGLVIFAGTAFIILSQTISNLQLYHRSSHKA